jgi:rhodanese-related sulfurtransferase
MSANDVAAAMKRPGVVLVDVREPAEFQAEHIEGAVLRPLSTFDPALLPQGEVIFQCGSGKRSVAAIQRAAAVGLPHTAHLQGGLLAWKQAGLPTIKG